MISLADATDYVQFAAAGKIVSGRTGHGLRGLNRTRAHTS